MDPLNGDPQISTPDGNTSVPIQVLGEGSAVVRDVIRLGRPAVITDDGMSVAAIVDAATYDALRLEKAARDLKRDLALAMAAADAGDVVDHEVVVREIRERFAGRVPPSVLQELDEVDEGYAKATMAPTSDQQRGTAGFTVA
jgi:PHD/YefM family antitoxin component YafN of YafNO toxin-antitoxin module